ncbi:hypothetical protein [Halalkalibacter okhensis]|nr:hypothetical protein [Halalkalibacter okhensis]
MNHKKWFLLAGVVVLFIIINLMITNLTQKDEDLPKDVNPVNSNITTH